MQYISREQSEATSPNGTGDWTLFRRIYPGQGCYDDCYSAGMQAYLYSIHRCALMGYTNVIGYIAKMQRIYLICAIVVYRDTAYLCKEHGLRETRLEQVGYVIV